MEIAKGKIGNALTSTADNHVVAVAVDLYDEELGEYQSEINKKVGKITNIEGENGIDIVTTGDTTYVSIEYFDGGTIHIE